MSQIPTRNDWRELVQAALEFQKAEPWRYLNDHVFFGMEDSSDGQRYFCTIQGSAGEPQGLTAYRGDAGLRSLIALQENLGRLDPFTLYYLQDCLQAAFEPYELLDDTDREILKGLVDRHSDTERCPHFRSLSPRLVPWYLSQSEAQLMGRLLRGSVIVTQRIAQEPGLLHGTEETDIPLFSWNLGDLTRQFIRVEIPKLQTPCFTIEDSEEVNRLSALPVDFGTTWIVRSFLSSSAVPVNDHHGFPTVVLWYDTAIEQVLHVDSMRSPQDGALNIFRNTLAMMEYQERRPGKVLFTEPELEILLGRAFQQFGQAYELVESLPVIDAVIEDFHEHFQNGTQGEPHEDNV